MASTGARSRLPCARKRPDAEGMCLSVLGPAHVLLQPPAKLAYAQLGAVEGGRQGQVERGRLPAKCETSKHDYSVHRPCKS